MGMGVANILLQEQPGSVISHLQVKMTDNTRGIIKKFCAGHKIPSGGANFLLCLNCTCYFADLND